MDSSDDDDLARSEDPDFDQLMKQLPMSDSPKGVEGTQIQEPSPASDPSLSDEEEGGESEEDELEDEVVDQKEGNDSQREYLFK